MIDTLALPAVLDPAQLSTLLAELRVAEGAQAAIYGRGDAARGSIDLRTRATIRLAVSPSARAQVNAALEGRRSELESHFDLSLSRCEEPQFLRYETGGFFVAHQDGNTPLLHDDTRFRRISIVLFLNEASQHPCHGCYGGGELVLHGPLRGPTLRLPLTPAAGTLLAFRAETTHEVLPVTHGERYTIASWWR